MYSPLGKGNMYSPLGRGKGWVLIMNTLEVSLHEFTPIQVEYPPTAFFFTKNRECSRKVLYALLLQLVQCLTAVPFLKFAVKGTPVELLAHLPR